MTVAVDGEVKRAGAYPVVGRVTLMRAVALAGGTAEFAKLEDVVIFRTVGGKDYVGIYNLGAIRRGNYADPEVFPNDVVIVGDSPQRRRFNQLLMTVPALLSPIILLASEARKMSPIVNGRQAMSDKDLIALENEEARYDSSRFGLSILEQVMSVILNHRYLVLSIVTGSLVLGLLLTFIATPQYTSTARIEILPDAPVSTSVEGERERSVINEVAFYNTQYSLLESRSLAERVVRAGNLTANEEFLRLFKLDSSEGTLSSAQRQSLTTNAAMVLLDRLTVSPMRASSLVDVSFSTPSPALSAKLTDLWVTQFVQSNVDRRFAATSDARKYLEKRLDTLRH